MSYEEKLAEGKKLKGEGVKKYNEGDISSARDLFTRAIVYLENFNKYNEVEIEGINLYITILSNLCSCCNKQNENYSVINYASKGLEIVESPKLYHFRSIAYIKIYEFDLAKKDLESLKYLLPEKEREIEKSLKYVNQLIEKKKKEINKRNNLLKIILSKNKNLVNLGKMKSIKNLIKNDIKGQKEEKYKEKSIIKNEINIIYKINNENKIRIFSNHFVNNNYLNCKIIYKGEEINLRSHLEIKESNIKKKKLNIILKGINNIIDASLIFSE